MNTALVKTWRSAHEQSACMVTSTYCQPQPNPLMRSLTGQEQTAQQNVASRHLRPQPPCGFQGKPAPARHPQRSCHVFQNQAASASHQPQPAVGTLPLCHVSEGLLDVLAADPLCGVQHCLAPCPPGQGVGLAQQLIALQAHVQGQCKLRSVVLFDDDMESASRAHIQA